MASSTSAGAATLLIDPLGRRFEVLDHLLDRLGAGLAPHYRIIRHLAAGGMGVVYLAEDPALRRQVAVKVLRPELATAAQAERFLREARVLASLSHPNVVTVFSAGEAAGLFYFIMQYAEGETLAARLERGPLPPSATLALARELLAGLEAIHSHGIVHRDLKPANVLLGPDRAMIADFGIALVDSTTTEEAPPSPDSGTVAYMAPEQRQRLPATTRTDVYSAGMVLYEAATGRRWDGAVPPGRADWHGVPARLRPILERALAQNPADRWASATAMRTALNQAPIGRRAAVIGAAGLGAVALWFAFVRRPDVTSPADGSAAPLFLAAPAPRSPLSDSMALALGARLGQNPDFRIVPAPNDAGITIATTVIENGTDVRLSAAISGRRIPTPIEIPVTAGTRHDWPALIDSLAGAIVHALYLGQVDADPWLPRNALPASNAAIQAWFQGELAYTEARWEDAGRHYHDAERLDSTCLLCAYRLNDVDRWLGQDVAPGRNARLLANVGRFPPHYQALIRAYASPWPARYDSLEAVPPQYKDFAIGWFAAGDEAFHRAGLLGHPRAGAIDLMLKAVRIKPRFAPAWEHLAWLDLALGDQTEARKALDSLNRAPAASGFSAALHQSLELGYAWRFESEAAARALTDRVLASPSIQEAVDLAAGARVMMTMGAPAGALYLGEAFERLGGHDLIQSGLWGQLFGLDALGRTENIPAVVARLLAHAPDPETEAFLTEWAAAHFLLRGEPVPDSVQRQLASLASDAQPASKIARRLGWIEAVINSSLPVPPTLDPAADALLLGTRTAGRGDPGRALALTESFHPVKPEAAADPFLPLLFRWFRATWLEQTGRAGAAAQELAGHQHLDLHGLPTGPPEAGEVDWATAPLVDWRRIRLLGNEPSRAERCRTLGEIVRLWRAGSPWARIRADSAAALASTLCRSPS